MPKGQSTKRVRDEAVLRDWDARPDAHFEPLGLTRDALKAAQLQLQGHIVLPGDPTYDADRMLSNPAFNPAPSMIVFCATQADVAIALRLAKSSPMPFSVRSGGHCTAGFSAGYGVLIDVKALDWVTIDVNNMVATVGAGCDMGQLNQQLALYGVHVPGGECDDVCIGGFVQGGGLGFTSTMFGMNCDNAIEMVVMLADGSIVVANSQMNADLWFAMRGGTGGNFGVLLQVKYRLYQLDGVFGFALAWPLRAPADVPNVVNALMFLQAKYMQASPYWPQLNLQALWVYQTIIDPKQPPLPEAVCVFMIRGLWVGGAASGAAAMQPLAALPGAIVQWTAFDTYNSVLDKLLGDPQDQPIIDPTMGMPNEDKASRYVAQALTAQQWTDIVNYFVTATPNTLSYMYLELYGGAIQTAPFDNAFIHRNAFYNAVLDVFWYLPKDRAASEAFLTGWINLMETVWNGEVYQNYASIDVPDYTDNYWDADVLWFLQVIKRKFDPTNEFVFAQQVPFAQPTTAGPPAQPEWLAGAITQPIDYTGGVKAPAASS